MTCPSCGRALAAGARRCVFCGSGSEFRHREELKIPQGALPPRKRGTSWGRWILLLVLAGAAAAAYFHPELHARIRSLIPF